MRSIHETGVVADERHQVERLDFARSGKYITFQISGKYFALPVDCVREIMPMQPLLRWAVETTGVLGAVQSRGCIIPIFDLRSELHLKGRGSSRGKSLILVKSHAEAQFGFAVDKITDHLQVHAHEIRAATIIGHGRVRTILSAEALIPQDRLFEAVFSRSSISSL